MNQSELFGLSGGVSYLSVDNAGKRTIKKLSDMSYQADL